jgi:hypothetical protein
MPTRAWLWWAARLDQGRDRGAPGRFTDGRLWVRGIRGCMAPSGEWSGRAFGRRRRRRQSLNPALVATWRDAGDVPRVLERNWLAPALVAAYPQ